MNERVMYLLARKDCTNWRAATLLGETSSFSCFSRIDSWDTSTSSSASHDVVTAAALRDAVTDSDSVPASASPGCDRSPFRSSSTTFLARTEFWPQDVVRASVGGGGGGVGDATATSIAGTFGSALATTPAPLNSSPSRSVSPARSSGSVGDHESEARGLTGSGGFEWRPCSSRPPEENGNLTKSAACVWNGGKRGGDKTGVRKHKRHDHRLQEGEKQQPISKVFKW